MLREENFVTNIFLEFLSASKKNLEEARKAISASVWDLFKALVGFNLPTPTKKRTILSLLINFRNSVKRESKLVDSVIKITMLLFLSNPLNISGNMYVKWFLIVSNKSVCCSHLDTSVECFCSSK